MPTTANADIRIIATIPVISNGDTFYLEFSVFIFFIFPYFYYQALLCKYYFHVLV
jgi:hypothetical protein